MQKYKLKSTIGVKQKARKKNDLFKKAKRINNLVKNPINGGTPAIENKVEENIILIDGQDFNDVKTKRDVLFAQPRICKVHIMKIEDIL